MSSPLPKWLGLDVLSWPLDVQNVFNLLDQPCPALVALLRGQKTLFKAKKKKKKARTASMIFFPFSSLGVGGCCMRKKMKNMWTTSTWAKGIHSFKGKVKELAICECI